MPLPWLSALKLIPWTDVIAATPQIVKGARNLYDGVRGGADKKAAARAAGTTTVAPLLDGDPQTLAVHVQQLQGRVQELEEEQTRTAELLQSLAEQNAQVVATVETLRQRSRLLVRVSAVLGTAVAVLAIVVARLH
ncbi:hypothetical protein [Xylophilus sp.]|uniref:hypothetical protein n=1 Tax=Xylophilus sp. TaxID=2653893 RepID=UPI0013BDE5F2|nr:hypothetical protein [Xylophilus sp.]KAF1045823.1 MAG: hypothetical protein GAK38_02810 [Xylophilus sp.]